MTSTGNFLCTPAKQEDLQITFAHYEPLAHIINPEDVFANTNFHFTKLAVGNYFWFISDTINWITHSCGGMLEEMTAIKGPCTIHHLFKNA